MSPPIPEGVDPITAQVLGVSDTPKYNAPVVLPLTEAPAGDALALQILQEEARKRAKTVLQSSVLKAPPKNVFQLSDLLKTSPDLVAGDPSLHESLAKSAMNSMGLSYAPLLANQLAHSSQARTAAAGQAIPETSFLERRMKQYNQRINHAVVDLGNAQSGTVVHPASLQAYHPVWWERNFPNLYNKVASLFGLDVPRNDSPYGEPSNIGRAMVYSLVHTASFGLIPYTQGAPQNLAESTAKAAGGVLGFLASPIPAARGVLDLARVGTLLPAALRTSAELGIASGLENLPARIGGPAHEVPGSFLGDLTRGAALGLIFHGAAVGVPEGGATGLLARLGIIQSGTDLIQGRIPFYGLETLHKQTPEQQSATLSNFFLNAFFSRHEAVPGTREAYHIVHAQLAGEDLKTMGESATNNEWRKLDPQGFHQFLDEAAPRSLYIDPAKLMEGAQSDPSIQAVLDKMPAVQAQIPEARDAGHDVAIPFAEYLTEGVESSAFKTLMEQHAKAIPDGLSVSEADAAQQQFGATFKKEAEWQKAQLEADKKLEDSRDALTTHLTGELEIAGRPKVEAKAGAQVRAQFFQVLGSRVGLSAQEAYQRFGAGVVGETLREAPKASMKQGSKGVFDPVANVIYLMKSADPSTLLHEAGHEFLSLYGRLAANPKTPQILRDDMDGLLQDFAIAGDTPQARIDTWNGLSQKEREPYHERFAKGFERYVMEGKAPTPRLRGVFRKYRDWLVGIYRSVRSLPDISSGVRSILDRMLATEDEIRLTEHEKFLEPLIKERPKDVSEEQWAAYQSVNYDATQSSIETMLPASLHDQNLVTRSRLKVLGALTKRLEDSRKNIQDEVTHDVDSRPEYQAERELRSRDGPKLSLGLLEKNYADSRYKELPRSMLRKDGLDPLFTAGGYGYHDVYSFIDAMLDKEPRDSLIEGLTDQRMLQEHGELIDPASINRVADAAVYNESRARSLATGMKLLAKGTVSSRAIVHAANKVARETIAHIRIQMLNPKVFEAGERRASKSAVKLLPKDPEGALVAHSSALLNHELFRESLDARTVIAKELNELRRLVRNKGARSRIHPEALDQIDSILERYDFRKVPPEEARQRNFEKLDAFLENAAANGYNPDVPEFLLKASEKTPFTELEVQQFKGLAEGLRSLARIGRDMRTVQFRDTRITLEEAVVAAQNEVQDSGIPQKDLRTNRGLIGLAQDKEGALSLLRGGAAALRRIEGLVDQLDHYDVNGVFNSIVWRPISDGYDQYMDLHTRIANREGEALDALPTDTFKGVEKRSYTIDGALDSRTKKPQVLRWDQKIALAGIKGDFGHFDKLLRGEGWKPEVINRFLDENMSKEEWGLVRTYADGFAEVYDLKKAMLKQIGTKLPADVPKVSFPTPHGEMPGWYWPIRYDPARGTAEKPAHERDTVMRDRLFRSISTATGRENTRVERYAKPVLLSLQSLGTILDEEIRDATMRPAIMNADKFTREPAIRELIERSFSFEHYKAFRGWLHSVASDSYTNPEQLKEIDQMARAARMSMTSVGLGLRFTTAIQHGATAGAESLAELGPKWMADGAAAFKNPAVWAENAKAIYEMDPYMRGRVQALTRDLKDKLLEVQHKLHAPGIGAAKRLRLMLVQKQFIFISMLDQASALPTWRGAYDKAMEIPSRGGLGLEQKDAIAYAGKTVRNAHGSGRLPDMAAIQKGSEFQKLFTMFYSFWNHNWNRLVDTAYRGRAFARELPGRVQNGEWGLLANDFGTIALRAFVYSLVVQAVHHTFYDVPPANEPTWKRIGKDLTLSAAGGIPIVRNIAEATLEKHEFSLLPATTAWYALSGSFKDLVKVSEGTPPSKSAVKHAVESAGYVFGLPLGQPANTLQFLWNVDTGTVSPDSTQEWIRGIITGRATQ